MSGRFPSNLQSYEFSPLPSACERVIPRVLRAYAHAHRRRICRCVWARVITATSGVRGDGASNLQSREFSPFTNRMCEESWRASTGLEIKTCEPPETPSSRTDTRPRRAARRIVSLSRPTHQASISYQAHPACGFSPLSSASAAPWAPRHRPSSGR